MSRLPVVVTGAGGFIGRHVVDALCDAGFRVRAVDLPARLPSHWKQSTVENLFADLRDRPEAHAAFKGASVCIALAANSAGVRYFNVHAATMLDDNARIIGNSFAAAVEQKMQRVIYVSSSCVFDRAPTHVASESILADSPPPPTGYPFSKLVGEAYCTAFAAEFDIAYTILRPFNVYGPGERPGVRWGDAHVIPDLVEKILRQGSPIELFGSGNQTRSFTYISDVVSGVRLALTEAAAVNQDFNLGTPEEISIRDLASLIWKLTNHSGKPEFKTLPSFAVDTPRRAVSNAKAKQFLGWCPKVTLRAGLSKYIDWYRQTQIACPASTQN